VPNTVPLAWRAVTDTLPPGVTRPDMPATVLETTRPLMTARGKRKNEPQLPAIVVTVTFQLPSKTVRARAR